MGAAGHFPVAEHGRVRLPGGVVADRLGLRVEREHGYVEVGADPHCGRHDRRGQRGAARRAGHHHEPVRHTRVRVDSVHVRRQPAARLGLADGEDEADREASQRVDTARSIGADGSHRLREDVIRRGVVGDRQRAVADRIPDGERSGQPGNHRRQVHTATLGGDADPRVALAQQLLVELEPRGVDVEAAADVLPLDDDGAVEPIRRDRPADQDPCRVRHDTGLCHGPGAVRVEARAGRRTVGRGLAPDEVLLFDVTERFEVERRRRERPSPVAARDRPRDGGMRVEIHRTTVPRREPRPARPTCRRGGTPAGHASDPETTMLLTATIEGVVGVEPKPKRTGGATGRNDPRSTPSHVAEAEATR